MVYEYFATIIDIYDGDTCTVSIDLGFSLTLELKCRLYGIDTPELRNKDKEEKRRGYLARDYLRERILNKQVILKTYKPDKYGRCLVDIYLDETLNEPPTHINKELIDKEYAKEYYGGTKLT